MIRSGAAAGTGEVPLHEDAPGGRQQVAHGSLRLIIGLSLAILVVMFAVLGQTPLRVGWDDLHMGPDDAARIVQVRDLAEGQGWFDLRQYRLGPDEPVMMHWSRLVDLPLLLIREVAEVWTTPSQADRASALLWPFALALLWMLVTLTIAGQMAGRRGIWCGAALLLAFVLGHSAFWPGRVDHHNLQLVLVLAMASALMAGRAQGAMAALAGAVAAASIAVGLETLPVLAVASGAVAFNWALGGSAASRATAAGFGLGLAAGLLVLLVTTIPAEARLLALCDQLSLAVLVPVGIGALGLSAAAVGLARAGRGLRLSAVALVGAASVAAAALAFPQCMAGPYGQFDAELQSALLVLQRMNVVEALAVHGGAGWYAYVLWPLAGLIGLALAVLVAPPERRFGPALLLTVATAATAIAWLEIRGFVLAMPLTLLGGIYALQWVSRWRGLARVAQPVAVVLLLVVVTPAGYLATPGFTAPAPAEGGDDQMQQPEAAPSAAQIESQAASAFSDCTTDREMAPLAELPVGRVLSATGEGSFILLKTPHHVIAAPYHRNKEGWRAGYRLSKQDPAATREMMLRLDVDYLALCPGRERFWSPKTLSAEIARGNLPAWLIPLPGGEHLKIYRFDPSATPGASG